MTYFMVGAAVISAAGAIYTGVQSNKAGKAKAGQERVAGAAAQGEASMTESLKKQEAADIRTTAAGKADQIKAAALQARSLIVNQQASSGAVIGEGSAQAAVEQVNALATADALAALYSGANAAVSAETQGRFTAAAGMERNKAAGAAAASAEAAGQAALVGGYLQAGASIAGAAGKYKAGTSSPKTGGGLNTGGT